MKSVKKRIIIFILCFAIIGTNVFLSYENTMVVNAEDNEEGYGTHIVSIALIIGAVLETVLSGGTLTPVAAAQAAFSLGLEGKEIYDIVQDNEDGTYTMSEEFINTVLEEAQKVQNDGFTAKDVINQRSGKLYSVSIKCVSSWTYKSPYETETHTEQQVRWSTDSVNEPLAGYCYKEAYSNGSSSYWIGFCERSGSSYTSYSPRSYYSLWVDGEQIAKSATLTSACDWAITDAGTSASDGNFNVVQSLTGNIPIFSSRDACIEYVKTGKGYKDALNYTENPPLRYGSSYSCPYVGGSVRFSRVVLENIVEKINEVDQQDISTDEKLIILKDYITNYSGDSTGNGSDEESDSEHDNYDDTETNTETDTWLKKIYNKLVDIFNDLHDRSYDIPDSGGWLEKIHDKLDDILSSVKSIRRWTIADTLMGLFLNASNADLMSKKQTRKAKHCRSKVSLNNRTGRSIDARPAFVKDREVYGHWEMDTVVSAKNTGLSCLLVLSERMTREEIVMKIKNKKSASVVHALNMLERKLGSKGFREKFCTITCDNGVEFLDASGIEKSRYTKGNRTTLYYCHPYSSYERGTNENINRMIRRFFPKGTNFDNVTKEQVAMVEGWINNYPRKILGGISSNQYRSGLTVS